MSRHPYTNAYDLLRITLKENALDECKLSRADCAKLTNVICTVLEIDHEAFCAALSTEFMRSNGETPPQDDPLANCVVCGHHAKDMLPLRFGNFICPACAGSLGGVEDSKHG